MNNFEEKRTISGKWGEVWIDNNYVGQIKGFTAEIELQFEDVAKSRQLAVGKKLTGLEPTGELQFHKVNSRYQKLISDNLKRGKATEVKIISNLDDPDSDGNERVVIYDALLGTLTLASWELENLLEEVIPFTFTDWDFEDVI